MSSMTWAVLLVAWCVLLVLSWPIALALLILAPLIGLPSLPAGLLAVGLGAAPSERRSRVARPS